MPNWKLFFLFLSQNICCGYSKEPSQWDGSFEHEKHMFKLMDKKIIASFTIFFPELALWNYVSPLQGRETYCFSPGVCPSVCLSVRPSVCHKSCPLYNLKTAQALFRKLYTNINQHELTCRVQEWQLCLLYFLSYFPLKPVHHKNRVRSITWKLLKLYSRNFIQILISTRWRAECKNGNSAFYTFWVIYLWTLCITKMVSAL